MNMTRGDKGDKYQVTIKSLSPGEIDKGDNQKALCHRSLSPSKSVEKYSNSPAKVAKVTNNTLEAKNRGLEKLEGNNGSLNTSKPLINCYIGIFVTFVRQYFRRLEWKSRK